MGKEEPQSPKQGTTIRFPLMFSASLGAVAGVVVLVASAGGTEHGLRWDLGAMAFGIAFIASLLVSSLLVMGYKENPDYLSEGSGVNRRSSDRLPGAKSASAAPTAAQPADVQPTDAAPTAAQPTDAAPADVQPAETGDSPEIKGSGATPVS